MGLPPMQVSMSFLQPHFRAMGYNNPPQTTGWRMQKSPRGPEMAFKMRNIFWIVRQGKRGSRSMSIQKKPKCDSHYVMAKPIKTNVSPMENSNKHIFMEVFGQKGKEGGYVQLWMETRAWPL